ncbi:hypothetical protein VNO77_03663 [Canavalia gladiata]|uniref:Uncharacterized protein n=1 Tax=Canavalia gladiata TaxID=3824 RepID=A0AAN9RCG1_CANGL
MPVENEALSRDHSRILARNWTHLEAFPLLYVATEWDPPPGVWVFLFKSRSGPAFPRVSLPLVLFSPKSQPQFFPLKGQPPSFFAAPKSPPKEITPPFCPLRPPKGPSCLLPFFILFVTWSSPAHWIWVIGAYDLIYWNQVNFASRSLLWQRDWYAMHGRKFDQIFLRISDHSYSTICRGLLVGVSRDWCEALPPAWDPYFNACNEIPASWKVGRKPSNPIKLVRHGDSTPLVDGSLYCPCVLFGNQDDQTLRSLLRKEYYHLSRYLPSTNSSELWINAESDSFRGKIGTKLSSPPSLRFLFEIHGAPL